MRVIYSSELNSENFDSPVVSLGNFDGVHLGHQNILRNLKKKAEQYSTKSLVHTFEPHPLKVIAPHKSPMLINSLEEKIALIDSFGIDLLICADFTAEFAKQHP
jgi:riboflavin kinase/FMN adenylyltransferase